MELNGKITDEYMKKYNILNEMMQSKDENIAKLVKERFSEQTQHEQEKAALLVKISALNDLVSKDNLLVQELKGKNANLQQMNETANETLLLQKLVLDENKQLRDNLCKKIEEGKVQIGLLTAKIESLETTQARYIQENENLNARIKEKQEFITQKLERTKNLSKDMELNDDDIEYLKLEVKKLRRMVMCTVCNSDEKAVVIAKCSHMFCKKCIDKNLEVRARKCPSCRTKFGADDVKQVYWD